MLAVRQSRSQTQCSNLWYWNETLSAYAHIIRSGVLHNGQQLQCARRAWLRYRNLVEVMKMLSVCGSAL